MQLIPSASYSAPTHSHRSDTVVDSLSDKETAKGLPITIGTLVVVMLALILVSNIL